MSLTDSPAPARGVAGADATLSIVFGPAAPYERSLPIHRVFEQQAARTPAAPAVLDDAGMLSYAQLDRAANQLAQHLRARGIVVGSRVGVAFERSRNLPVAFLAILKAGCAYVPLDAGYPAERIAFISADAALTAILTECADGDSRRFGGVSRIDLEREATAIARASAAPLDTSTPAEALAYIMYTSGSTGRAKGVAIPHRAVVRLVRGADYFTTGSRETFVAFAPAAFDASTFEIWGALLNGARLAIPRPGLFSIADLGELIDRFAVTTLWLTAALFARVVEARLPAFARLHQLLTGGSAGSASHMREFLALYPQCRLINGYGPTENTTFSTTFELSTADAIGTKPPIGSAIAHSNVYVVDDALQLVPRGTAGELCVGGDGVALGYVNLPGETAARFRPDPFCGQPGALLYRTGDRARMRADGVIEFLGRTDDQVKISGYRIELGEIEATLRANSAVRDAAVVAIERSPGESTLSAYVVAAAGEPLDEQAVRRYLRLTLPAFMVPPHIAMCADLPLYPSGKIDRRTLAALASAAIRAPAIATPPADVAPFTYAVLSTHAAHAAQTTAPAAALPQALGRAGLTRAVAALWSEAIATGEPAETNVNFFDAGGDSLRLLRLQSLLSARLSSTLTVIDLFEHTTIAQIVDALATGARR